MAKVGLYSDPHITRKMGVLQEEWENSVLDTFTMMYGLFAYENVNYAICAGDFFDKAIIEARSLPLVLEVLDIINKKDFKTYFLLGNHEIDSADNNILSFLHQYQNIEPVMESNWICDNVAMIPYGEDPVEFLEHQDIDENFGNYYLITHHDIQGSSLAGGRAVANFGLYPSQLSGVTAVFNGHIHLRGVPAHNVLNIGSVLCMQQGELLSNQSAEYPRYYLVDTEKNLITDYENRHSLIFRKLDVSDLGPVLSSYSSAYADRPNLVLDVEYGESEVFKGEEWIKEVYPHINFLRVKGKKRISASSLTLDEETQGASSIDLKNVLSRYISMDETIPADLKEKYIADGISLMEESSK